MVKTVLSALCLQYNSIDSISILKDAFKHITLELKGKPNILDIFKLNRLYLKMCQQQQQQQIVNKRTKEKWI